MTLDEVIDTKHIAIHCETVEQAKRLCDVLHAKGRKWCDGDSYKEDTSWSWFKEKTCYVPSEDYRTNVVDHTSKGRTILSSQMYFHQLGGEINDIPR